MLIGGKRKKDEKAPLSSQQDCISLALRAPYERGVLSEFQAARTYARLTGLTKSTSTKSHASGKIKNHYFRILRKGPDVFLTLIPITPIPIAPPFRLPPQDLPKIARPLGVYWICQRHNAKICFITPLTPLGRFAFGKTPNAQRATLRAAGQATSGKSGQCRPKRWFIICNNH